MENWRDKSDRDNLVGSTDIRPAEREDRAPLEQRISLIEAQQRGVPSWVVVGGLFILATTSSLAAILALYSVQLSEERLRNEFEARNKFIEEKIDRDNRSIIDAISRINYENRIEDDVFFVQMMLKSLGYDLDVTGFPDEQTTMAIINFQEDQGIVVDGIIGREVRSALRKAIREISE